MGMKTAVSIPDEIFEKAEKLRRRKKKSRSEIYSAALSEYVARNSPDEITEALNRMVDELGDEVDPFVQAHAEHVLRNTEWE